MYGSITLARWRQCALPCGHMGTTWRIRLKLCFHWPTRVHNLNGKSISSAVIAQLMAGYNWVHWCHLANTIELVLPSAHRIPQSKQQIDRFSRFCTAHCTKSLYFTMGDPFCQNCPFSWGIWTPSNSSFLAAVRAYNLNGTTIGSAVFAQVTTERPYTLQWTAPRPQNCPFPWGIWTPISHMVPSAHTSPQPKWHLDRFSHFCRAH